MKKGDVLDYYDLDANMIGGFGMNDATVDFYLRINNLVSSTSRVVDYGAGRGEWYKDDKSMARRSLRTFKGKVKEFIAADIDNAVLNNETSDRNCLIVDGKLPLESASVDLIIADFVLEHVDDVESFTSEIKRCLKSGGWFCARTPHKYSYIAVFASLISNRLHSRVLKRLQPDRKEIDVFPTKYRLNTIRDVNSVFDGWFHQNFIFRANPAYYFGSKAMFSVQSLVHRLLPDFFSGNLFIFVRKP